MTSTTGNTVLDVILLLAAVGGFGYVLYLLFRGKRGKKIAGEARDAYSKARDKVGR